MYEKSEKINEYDLINEYERKFPIMINEYRENPASMEEKRL